MRERAAEPRVPRHEKVVTTKSAAEGNRECDVIGGRARVILNQKVGGCHGRSYPISGECRNVSAHGGECEDGSGSCTCGRARETVDAARRGPRTFRESPGRRRRGPAALIERSAARAGAAPGGIRAKPT